MIRNIMKYSPQNQNLPNYGFVRDLLLHEYNKNEIEEILKIIYKNKANVLQYIDNKFRYGSGD